jgi:ABC-2 type transport system ATP-binding protein
MRLTLEGLGKRYRGDHWGLRGVDCELGPGVVGLLGPNGAGKSTLLRIVATITGASEGRALWNGADVARDPDAVRRVLGYLPQDFGIYPNLTPREFLAYLAAAKGIPRRAARERIEALLDLVHLREEANRRLGGFSGGMRQRVGIAQALLGDPRLLIVDEPTTGLDPEERVRFRNLLSDLSGERIVVLSTHIVPDVESVATDLVVIDRGRLVAHEPPERLLAAVEGKVWQWLVPSAELPAVRERFQISATLRRSDGVEVRAVAEAPPAAGARAVPSTLEDGYLWRIARHRREAAA